MNLKLDVINNSDIDILHILVHFIKVRILEGVIISKLNDWFLEFLHCQDIIFCLM